jgi:WG containing repeat
MRTLLLLLFFAGLTVSGGSFCRMRQPATDLIRIQQQGKTGYIDPAGTLVVPAVYDNGSDFSEGLAAVREGGYYGYIDATGRFVILPKFDWAEPFSEGLAAVHADGHFFYIDRHGAPAFRCPYTTLSAFQHGVAIVQAAGRHRGLIDRRGRLVLDTLYDVLRDFDEGLAFVDQDVKGGSSREGVVDTFGHFIIPIGKYATVGYPKHGYCLVRDTTDDQILIDRMGEEVLRRPETSNSGIDPDGFSEGVAPVERYKYWEPEKPGVSYTSEKAYKGYIDLQGHMLLNDTLVSDATPFLHGRAFIRTAKGGWRLIDRQMHRVGTDEYFQLGSSGFVQSQAIVTLNGNQVVIDTTGRVIFRPAEAGNHQLSFLGDRYLVDEVVAGDTTHIGIRTLTGRLLYPPQLEAFDEAGFCHGLLKVVLAGRLAVLDTTGRLVWRDSSPPPTKLPPLHIDYMLRGYFYAYSAPDPSGNNVPGGGWAVSHNIPKKIDNPFLASDSLQLLIDTSVIDTFSGAYSGYRVYLANSTHDTCRFDAEDSRLYLTTQAKGFDGSWKDIDYLPGSWCGNSYHRIDLEPGAYWMFTMPKFDGAIAVSLRLRLERARPRKNEKPVILYSNVIRGRVNPAQFWNKRPYTPQGLMDPYNE